MIRDKNTIVRHHLLEIILWPNGDGTFTEIRNSAERLKELGIYDDFKMTIPLTRAEHMKLHSAGQTFSDEHKQKLSAAHKGRTLRDETKKKLSEALTGKKPSDETRKKISEANKGLHKDKTWKLVNGKRVWIEKEENHG